MRLFSHWSIVAAISFIASYIYFQTNLYSCASFFFNVGVLKHMPHDGREARLLAHVKTNAPKGNASAVVDTIDKYAWHHEWYMNVGDEKGLLLDTALANYTAVRKPKYVLELGAYCGYSATRILDVLAKNGAEGASLISVEISPDNAAIATQMLAHAGLSARWRVLIGSLSEVLPQLQELVGADLLDFVFIDHDKHAYLSDALLLKNSGLLRPGAVLVADNLITPGAPDYIAYMEGEGAAEFDFVRHKAHLEYKSFVPDEVGVSVYRPTAAAVTAQA